MNAPAITIYHNPACGTSRNTPRFINGCHAWRQDGSTIVQEYPELAPPKE